MMDLKEVELELFAQQNEIIEAQNEAIKKLILLIKQYDDIRDEELKPITDLINHAADIRAEYNL
jgi:hypothetical protein